jgi:cyclophilin family peptidyl-prolyl cis-trans isomerase
MSTVLEGYAKEIGLDTAKFSKELTDRKYKDKIDAAYKAAGDVGLPGTPTFFINGVYIQAQQLTALDSLIAWFNWLDSNPQQFPLPDKSIDPAKKYTAIIKTAKGDISIELYADQTPNIVNSFVFLARQGYYNGTTFHRVLKDFVAQGGDPSGSGMGGPGYRCNDEIVPTFKFDAAGVVAMANSGANTNGSQFFITYAPLSQLDGRFSIFGRVVAGLDVAQSLTLRDPQQDPTAAAGDVIQSIVIEEK